jgi:dihydropteroate synthase
MGILNVTPDSFSDGGQLRNADAVVARAEAMIGAGVDVLDIGGESTRPGAEPVGEQQELARVLPAIRAVRSRWPGIPISIDTFKPRVAAAAVEGGADIVNDVWGGTHGIAADARAAAIEALARAGETGEADAVLPHSPMASTVARLGCPMILMHNRPDRNYQDFWRDFLNDLRLAVALATRAGVARHQIWLDPGFGFAKTPPLNLEVLKHLDRVVSLGFPVLVGTSRKSTIGKVLGTTAGDRLEGTGATVVWAIERGCRMVRVHDVPEMMRFVKMADAIKAGIDFRFPEPGIQ